MADKLSKQEKQRLKEKERFERERRKWKYQSTKQGGRKKAAKVDATAIVIKTIAIAVAAALVLGFAWVYSSNYSFPSRYFPVLTVGSQTVREPEWAFYFYNQYNQQANQSAQYGQMASMFGLVSLEESVFGQVKGPAFGQEEEGAEPTTWDKYIHEETNKAMHSLLAIYEQALKDGEKLNLEDRAEIKDHMQTMAESAKEQAMSMNAYLRLVYTPGLTEKKYRAMLERDYIIMAYEQRKNDEFSKRYSKAELREAYEENAELYDFVDYLALPFDKQRLTAEEGEDQAALDIRQAQADAETKARAQAFLAGAGNEQAFMSAAEAMERAAFEAAEVEHEHGEDEEPHEFSFDPGSVLNRYMRMSAIWESFGVTEDEELEGDGAEAAEWLFTAQAGAVRLVETANQFIAVCLARPAYQVLTREFYMIPVNKDEYDGDAAAAGEAAAEILAAWKEGDANLTSFKELADIYIDEETKAQNRTSEPGQVEKAIPGYSDVALDDWVFGVRKAGDTDVVDVAQGSAVVYYVQESKDEYSWLVELTQQNAQRDYEEYSEQLLEEYHIKEKKLGTWFALRTSKRLCDSLRIYINRAMAQQAQGNGANAAGHMHDESCAH